MEFPRNPVGRMDNSIFPHSSVAGVKPGPSPVPASIFLLLDTCKKVRNVFNWILTFTEKVLFWHAVNLICLVIFVNGCASFSSTQKQTKPDGTIVESHQRIFTFWDGKSNVAKLRASTTSQTQGLTVGSVDQETSSTNTIDLVERVVGAVVKAAIKP